jgi:simple sugar transport system ATP-binding protein
MNALELKGISKHFGACVANEDATLAVKRGTVHALCGENGAGKSTLMKIAYGQVRADTGDIVIAGQTVDRKTHSPKQAMAKGIGMVHQHFMLAGPLTVTENTILGREPTRFGVIETGEVEAELRALSQRFGFELDPSARIDDLSVGEQQRVEVLKVLWRGCDLLILDEPTAVLTPPEVAHLFEVVRGLVKDGMTVVLITHKLDEIKNIADRVSVMRAGRMVAELDGKEARPEAIAQAMVGRPVLLAVKREPETPGAPLLELTDVSCKSARGITALDRVSLTVREREIVGIAGVVGNGQTELMEVVAGTRRISGGEIRLAGEDMHRKDTRQRFAHGLAHIPEDRHRQAMVLDFSMAETVALGRQDEWSRAGVLDWDEIREETRDIIKKGDIRPAEEDAIMRELSGGNQQKVVVGRELGRKRARLLLCGQPTRGVDVGAVEMIHRRLLDVRKRGWGILLVSADLSELCALSDRMLVFYRGQIALEMTASELEQDDAIDRIGAAMTGANPHPPLPFEGGGQGRGG